jgi:putative endonuclease
MSRERSFWVYILASRLGGTLYIGVTNDLVRRVYEHRSKFVPGFTRKYGVARLIYFEQFANVEAAIQREKTAEELEPSVEDSAYRENQSQLGRSLRRNRRGKYHGQPRILILSTKKSRPLITGCPLSRA